jgi:hypothetical protein
MKMQLLNFKHLQIDNEFCNKVGQICQVGFSSICSNYERKKP